jgi:hypothetical protein
MQTIDQADGNVIHESFEKILNSSGGVSRKIRRNKHNDPDYQPPAQKFRFHADGEGYDVYHPTKGWLRVSGKRVRAQSLMARLKGLV